MSINHIDQLAEWYESAERITKTNLPRSGDYVISPFFNGTGFHVELEPDDWTADIVREEREDARILARAPKPKPAWHDAPAVIATYRDERGMVSGAWVREGKPGYWEGPEGDVVASEALEDVVPLIEAKVTDEQARKALNLYYESSPGENGWPENSVTLMRLAIAAALGLETA